MHNDTHFNFGAKLAAARCGVDAATLHARMGQDSVMSSSDAAPFNRELCKIAHAAFVADDAGESAPAILFRSLATAESWDAGYDVFSDCVKRAMAKQAMPFPLSTMTGGGVASDAARSLIATGAVGGATLGSLAFLLARNARQSSSKNAEILEKVRAFKQLRRDIEEDMASDEMMAASLPKKKERYNV